MKIVPHEKETQNEVWAPLPGSQTLAISCPCNEILYEGTRGPGKTDAQVMFFRSKVGLGYGSYWRGIIFEREYKQLDDLINKSKRWFPKFNDGAKFLASQGTYKWTWPTGEELLFRRIKKLSDYWDYHGHEYAFIGWSELCKYSTPELYELMKSCNRTSFDPKKHSPMSSTGERKFLPPIPLVIFSTANPYGPGHNWVRRMFIDNAAPGEVVRETTNVFNPKSQEYEDVTRTKVRIFGSYKENYYLTPEYIASLVNLRDENRRKAWLEGDWDIVVGGAFDGVWGDHLILPRFPIPKSWRIDRSFDWGSSHPFSVGWWAEANGEEATLPDGSRFCPPPGSLIRFAEWYGSTEKNIGSNVGLRMSAVEVARGIKEREASMRADGWISTSVKQGPADNSIGSIFESETESIATKMQANGVSWTASNKKPGSRVYGLQLTRDRMQSVLERDSEMPGIYFTRNCKASLAILPTLPLDEEKIDDVDTDSEDHIWDDVRYRVLAGNKRFASDMDIVFPN